MWTAQSGSIYGESLNYWFRIRWVHWRTQTNRGCWRCWLLQYLKGRWRPRCRFHWQPDKVAARRMETELEINVSRHPHLDRVVTLVATSLLLHWSQRTMYPGYPDMASGGLRIVQVHTWCWQLFICLGKYGVQQMPMRTITCISSSRLETNDWLVAS